MEQPGVVKPRFRIGALIIHRGAIAVLGEGHFDLALELVADHLQHAQPYEHGWLSGARCRGQQLAVATVIALKETHVLAAVEARELGEEMRARTEQILRI